MEISAYIADLITQYPQIGAVWLFGSRANGNGHADSDWDLFIFADEDTFRLLESDCVHRRRDIDLLVVIDGDEFKQPWGLNPKHGWLSEWEWKIVSPTEASYTAPSRTDTGGEWSRPLKTLRAVRVWPTYEP
jgi:predicted nucleotidyltransferase